jgi:hypothetical protein
VPSIDVCIMIMIMIKNKNYIGGPILVYLFIYYFFMFMFMLLLRAYLLSGRSASTTGRYRMKPPPPAVFYTADGR